MEPIGCVCRKIPSIIAGRVILRETRWYLDAVGVWVGGVSGLCIARVCVVVGGSGSGGGGGGARVSLWCIVKFCGSLPAFCLPDSSSA